MAIVCFSGLARCWLRRISHRIWVLVVTCAGRDARSPRLIPDGFKPGISAAAPGAPGLLEVVAICPRGLLLYSWHHPAQAKGMRLILEASPAGQAAVSSSPCLDVDFTLRGNTQRVFLVLLLLL